MEFNVQKVYKAMPLGSTAIEERIRADLSRWTNGSAMPAGICFLWLHGNLWSKHGSLELSWLGFKQLNLYYLFYKLVIVDGLHMRGMTFSKVVLWTRRNCSRGLRDEGYLLPILPTAGTTNPPWMVNLCWASPC